MWSYIFGVNCLEKFDWSNISNTYPDVMGYILNTGTRYRLVYMYVIGLIVNTGESATSLNLT